MDTQEILASTEQLRNQRDALAYALETIADLSPGNHPTKAWLLAQFGEAREIARAALRGVK